jgi:hypothetical protein
MAPLKRSFRPSVHASVRDRFRKKVAVGDPSGCHLWVGGLDRYGYGQIRVDGRYVGAHRVAWEIEHGPIPHGLVIDHLCRIPACVNPAHLEPVTERENILRGTSPSAIAARKTHCIHGHPFSGENLYLRKREKGWKRECRACQRTWAAAHKARKTSR